MKALSIVGFVSVGLLVGWLSLACASRIAVGIGGRLGEAVRGGSPNTMAIGAFWLGGLLLSGLLNVVCGCWAVTESNGHFPDHAFYAMSLLVMFTLPFMAACSGMAFVSAKL